MIKRIFYQINVNVECASKREWVPISYDKSMPNSQTQLTYQAFPNKEPIFSRLILKPPFYDFVYDGGAIAGKGFIISQKVKEIIQLYKLEILKMYELEVVEAVDNVNENDLCNVHESYYYSQIISNNYASWIDYSCSKFLEVDVITEQEKSIVFTDEYHFMQYIKMMSLKELHVKELVFKHLPKSDILFLPPLYINSKNWVMISEPLLDKLLNKKVVGFGYVPVELYVYN